MLKFLCFPREKHALLAEVRGGHLLGNDGIPVRGEVRFTNGEIHCQPRTQEPVALSLIWPVEGYGAVQLETTRLPERAQPYLMNLELARHRLMRITLKREEWGLFDYPGMEDISDEVDHARQLFVDALQAADDPPASADLADRALHLSLQAAERLAHFHATVFLGRRQQGGGFARAFLGAAISPACPPSALTPQVQEAFDFVRVPFTWREIQPQEQATRYERFDAWVKACTEAKLPLRGGPLLNFGVSFVPDWMHIWENDFETILDYACEHVRQCVRRYAAQIKWWIVASGLHADNVFSFNFEQIMEITRAATSTVRQLAPRSHIVLDLTQPWGEYFARNQRSIPPMLYADMAAQGGVSFDAFGLQFLFGIGLDGYHLRDAFQISALIDKVANLGKPLHVTAAAVPSASDRPNDPVASGGQWHGPWSESNQAEWLASFCGIALSKPYVESICLQNLVDHRNGAIPSGGVLRADFSPKPALTSLLELRKRLQTNPAK